MLIFVVTTVKDLNPCYFTFQLGSFSLLLTVYNNICLFYEGTNTCPVMLGPLMVCMLKNQCTYDTLFQKMSSAVPGLACYLQGYASDCEKALSNSMALAFPHSVGYICMIHGKKNIWFMERKTYQKWHDLELLEKLSPGFVQYFEKHKQENIKDHMRVILSKMLDLAIRLSLPIQLNPQMLWLSGGTIFNIKMQRLFWKTACMCSRAS